MSTVFVRHLDYDFNRPPRADGKYILAAGSVTPTIGEEITFGIRDDGVEARGRIVGLALIVERISDIYEVESDDERV